MWHNSDLRHGFLISGITLSTIIFAVGLAFVHTSYAQATASTGCVGTACVDGNTSNSGAPTFVPLASYKRSPGIDQAFHQTGLASYINNIFKIALSIGAILAVLRIAYGGYLYMGSADMWGNKQQAKEAIGDAVIGLLLLFAIYLILYQINPNLLNLNILSDIKQASTTTTQTQ